MRLLFVGSLRNLKTRTYAESGELRQALYPVDRADNMTGEGNPWQLGHPRDRAKREHETVSDRGNKQSLGRPSIAGTIKFGRRSGTQRREARAREGNVALQAAGCFNGRSMR